MKLTDVAFAEGLQRVAAHLENALLFYESDHIEQALIQASRPMVELMPRLSRDLWQAPEVGTGLNRSVAAIAAGIRSGLGRNRIRSLFVTAERSIDAATSRVVGDGSVDPAFVASVVVALLRTAADAYRGSAPDSEEGGARFARLDAVSFVRRARRVGVGLDESLDERLESLQTSMSTDIPASPDDVDAAIAAVSGALNAVAGASLSEQPAPAEHLERIGEFLSNIETAYAAGEAFRADKLAARAYLENNLAVHDELITSDPAADEAISSALIDLRLRMRAKAPQEEISQIAERGREALVPLLPAL